MAASRHNSISASAVYQRRGATSEYNRIDALLSNYETLNPHKDRKMPPIPAPSQKEGE